VSWLAVLAMPNFILFYFLFFIFFSSLSLAFLATLTGTAFGQRHHGG
jgi:hypothetical protein